MIDLLLSLTNAQFVRGNHDDVFDQVLSGQCYAGKPGEEQRVDGVPVVHAARAGQDVPQLRREPSAELIARCAAAEAIRRSTSCVGSVPEAHRKFIRELPLVIEDDDMFVAHAKWDVYTPTRRPADLASG